LLATAPSTDPGSILHSVKFIDPSPPGCYTVGTARGHRRRLTHMDIGARLQAVRKAKNLSQRELAKRVGVTNSTISLIEQNKVSPSVSSLKKVLDGIPISLADFFTHDFDDGAMDSPFYRAADLPDVGNNEIHYFLIGQHRPNRQMCLLREVMPPGSDTGETMLAHDGEEGGVVIAGQVEVTVGEQVRVLGPGDGYYFESRVPHRFRNVGSSDAIVVSANTPATF
jgi:transcriptional regulator with XRE-family HTH domain